jgi:hypothetical protein
MRTLKGSLLPARYRGRTAGPIADAMTNRNRFRQEPGLATTPVALVLSAILVLTVAWVGWLALHPPGQAAAPRLVRTPATSIASAEPRETPTPTRTLPSAVLDGNAQMRLRYAWLVASTYARGKGGSFTGLSPRIAERLLRSSGVDVRLQGEGPLVLTRFDTSNTATAGVVSVRVAQGRNLLLVTRSRTGTTFCFVQRGQETGIGTGDVHRVDQCVIRWG